MLELEVIASQGRASGDISPIRLLLLNRSKDPEYINSRLLFGPRTSGAELSVDLKRDDSIRRPRLVSKRKVNASTESREFQWLAPAQFIGVEVDLGEWFELEPGEYTVRASYQNVTQPPPDAPVVSAWTGRVTSSPFRLVVGP